MKLIYSILIILFEIENLTDCLNYSTKILNDIFINIDPKIDKASKVEVGKNYGSKYEFKIDLIDKGLTTSTDRIKEIKNRDIKIYYKTNPYMDKKVNVGSNRSSSILKLDNLDLNKLVQFNYLNESNQFFYLIKINRDFLVIIGSIFLIVLVSLSLITCFYKFIDSSHNDSYYFCKYHQFR